eukprot:10057721-Heterocapsa_arctica.AAC.1
MPPRSTYFVANRNAFLSTASNQNVSSVTANLKTLSHGMFSRKVDARPASSSSSCSFCAFPRSRSKCSPRTRPSARAMSHQVFGSVESRDAILLAYISRALPASRP